MMNQNFELHPDKSALLIIDMQNSYCHKDGSIGRAGYDVQAMIATIPKVKQLLAACRSAGILDIWTIQNHYPDDITRSNHRLTPHTHRWSAGPPALKGTWDAEVVDELKAFTDSSAELITKHRFSAFFDTRLDTLLRMKGIDTLLVCGVATTHCVETTIRDAYQRDYDVLVAKEAVGGLTSDSHNASLKLVNETFGAVISVDQMLDLINGQSRTLSMATVKKSIL
ncbi:cysteine hydrolase [Mesobacillus boroniphilus]|uniref:Cysteine hydrolase n=1 Tax=Mesobacillus boroniphilus TaxID=308892 RepID=A0A944GY20_9BACI|nr:isochorismatase family cysteine hydrolase [Mesobacillus boroniphilus]MBS8266497.1 cysteine hydrolase [Mesobacillus boroniphilus]